MLTSENVLVCTVSHLRRTTSVPSAVTATLNSSARWQLESVPWTVMPLLIVRTGGLVGEGMTSTLDAQDTPEGEMMTTQPEHAARGTRHRTVVATIFMTHSGLLDLRPQECGVKWWDASSTAPLKAPLLGTASIGLWDVLEDEELFARLDETELTAGEVLDRARIVLESLRLVSEPGVFGANVRQRLLERAILLPLLQHLEQALLADQRVEDQDAPHEHEQVLHGPAAATAFVGTACARRF